MLNDWGPHLFDQLLLLVPSPVLELSSGFYDEFVKALQAGTPLPVQPDQVLRVMEVIEAVRSSDAAGKSVVIRNVSTYG